MNNGYLMLQRRFFSHALWEESREFSRAEAFLDLLQLAAYAHTKKIVKGVLVSLAPGQLCASQRYMADRWGWSTKKVRHFFALLEADQIIEPQKNREGTIITLCNYEKYNSSDPEKEPQKPHRGTTEEPPRNQIKEREEGKRDSLFAPSGQSPAQEPKQSIEWSPQSGFTGITNEQIERWKTAYPAVNIERNIAAANEWLRTNPAKRKKQNARFLNNWLARSQEKGGDIASNGYRPANGHTPLFPGHRPDK